MAVPKQRHNKSRKNRRRGGQSGSKIVKPSLVKCSNCGAMILPHRICPQCGFYKGKSFLNVSPNTNKQEK